MFKVGQRVWDTVKKEFVTFKKVSEEHSLGTVAVIERDDFLPHLSGLCHYPLHLLHQTADDMFEELGWKEVDNDSFIYLIPKESDIDDLLNEYVEIDKETNQITGIFIGEKNIEEKHQAIHQKLIELGWIE